MIHIDKDQCPAVCRLGGTTKSRHAALSFHAGQLTCRRPKATVIEAHPALRAMHDRWGFWPCFHRLRAEGHVWTYKHVYREYRKMTLNRRRGTKNTYPCARIKPGMLNQF